MTTEAGVRNPGVVGLSRLSDCERGGIRIFIVCRAVTPAIDRPLSCRELLADYQTARSHGIRGLTQKLLFRGVGDNDVYNITAPFHWRGESWILGRVEARDTEHSEVRFFKGSGSEWEATSFRAFENMQDPCVTFVGDELVLGGVKFPVSLASGETGWRMEFYRGTAPDRLSRFFTGPDKMKDIRLKELADGRIAVLTRPQGSVGGRGKIGFTVVKSLDDLDVGGIERAPLFDNLFLDEEWGGANEVHLLPDGTLGVLGHIACFDEREHRHYYAIVFVVDPATGEASQPRIIAERSDFPDGPAKRPDLVNVIFSGGLLRDGDGGAILYAGVSDVEAACMETPDPFRFAENSGCLDVTRPVG
ncbi:MAG: DUF1861 family protein [Verrucomicrobia bacterium]|nr:DUF1861 family protein [Verrucomicrobiota bacterium]